MVYVLNKEGKSLMPTERYGKVKHMLKDGRAKVVKRTPFTIQLQYDTTEYIQPVTLGVDAGSKKIGLSATTENKELYASEVELRNDVVKNISQRRECRRTKRNRKTRYREPRFNNRKKKDGWLAPSVRQKINTHLKVISDVYDILPISKMIVEVASFDTQKLKNPDISGIEYQQGEQLDSWNVREYVLFRDNHKCQCCHGKSGNPILENHHLESRQTGGNAPNNLITVCRLCHKKIHSGKIQSPVKRGESFRDTAFMGIMRWALYDELKEKYDNVHLTYGYITKNTRIRNNLPKDHCVDARCITGNSLAEPAKEIFMRKAARTRNRQIHKMTINKGGTRKSNQCPKYIFGFQLYDKVLYKGQECFISGRRTSGSFALRTLDGTKISDGVSYKKLRLLEQRKSILTERVVRSDAPPMSKDTGLRIAT